MGSIRYVEGDAFAAEKKKELEARKYRQIFIDNYNKFGPGEFLVASIRSKIFRL